MKRALPLLSLLALAGCESPDVVPTADARQNTRTARIEGSVVVQSKARGNAVVFLYDKAGAPPPPLGAGRPVSFAIIPAAQLFGAALYDAAYPGPFTAPFTLSLVKPGDYNLRGFIDTSGCLTAPSPTCRASDFNPFLSVTAEPNAGDVGGGAVDLATGALRTVTVGPKEDPQPTTGVTVSFADSATVPFDRPSFQVTDADNKFAPTTTPMRTLTLKPQAMPEPINQRPPGPGGGGFWVQGVDANNDGTLDGFWPRVVVRKLTADGSADDTDYNNDGTPDAVVLTAGLLPDPLIAALVDGEGKPRPQPVFVSQLTVVLRNQALDALNPAAPTAVSPVPAGRYSVTLVQSTGQTWRLPNELAPTPAAALGLPGDLTQAFVVEVVP